MNMLERIAGVFGRKSPEAPAVRPGRNDDCWCGSGKKYKKCHLPEDEGKAAARSCALNCGPA